MERKAGEEVLSWSMVFVGFNYEDRCRQNPIDGFTNESFIIGKAIIVINIAANKEEVRVQADFSSGCRGSAFSAGDLRHRDPPFLISNRWRWNIFCDGVLEL